MASTSIFAPQVRPVQPAFINLGEVRIYFSFSAFSKLNINTIRYSIVDPSQSSTWGSNTMFNTTGRSIPIDIETGLYYKEISSWSQETGDNRVENEYYITLNLANEKSFSKNQFYQIQLWAVSGSGASAEVSAPSQTTLIRYIDRPILSIPASGSVYDLNNFSGTMSGSAETLAAISCKIGTNYIYEGDCSGTSFDINLNNHPFQENSSYQIKFTYETNHGYKETIDRTYTLTTPQTLSNIYNDSGANKNITIWGDIASGSVNISFSGGNANDFVERASEEENWTVWKKVGTLGATSKTPASPWRDCTIQSEIKYKYRIARLSSGVKYATPILNTTIKEWSRSPFGWQTKTSDIISVSFESIILSDRDCLLNLKYNLNVTGFKYVNQESITNTLGGRFPLVRRNGDTNYLQFSLSGLLYIDCTEIESSQAAIDSLTRVTGDNPFDEEDGELYINDATNISFSQSTNKILIEKRVRELVIKFLTNGRPKLLRAFEEGNLIVYLSGVSFTPNKQLDRHIYDFTATVTQLCEYTLDNLEKYQLNQHSYKEFKQAIRITPATANGVFYDGRITIKKEDQ
jgi:hypothetical protein